jgi:hypothetical protein
MTSSVPLKNNKEPVGNISKFSWGHRNCRHVLGVPDIGKE